MRFIELFVAVSCTGTDFFSFFYKGTTVISLIMAWKDFASSGDTIRSMPSVCCLPFMLISFVFDLNDD